MEIKEIRRAKLIVWFENRSVPAKEKSYLSQLMGGTASFGERAARRLEKTYGMGDGYLDAPPVGGDTESLGHESQVIEVASNQDSDGKDLQRALLDQAKLLLLYWSADARGRAVIMGVAETEADHNAAIPVSDTMRRQSQ